MGTWSLELIEILTIILIIVLVSRITEEYTTIPINLPLIAFSFFISALFPGALNITSQQFDKVLIMLLPIILFPDVINLSIKEVRQHVFPIFYLALLGVMVSLFIAVIAGQFLLQGHELGIGELACLFAPLLATDAITVTSMAGKFDLPKQLKLIAEGESLFNDATALIAFYFIALPLLNHGDVGFFTVSLTLLKVFVFSAVIGAIIAIIGFALLKLLRDPIEQFSSAYLVAIGAYLVADHLHYAGILALLVSLLFFRILIDKEVKRGLIFNYELHNQLVHGSQETGNYPPSMLQRILTRIEELLVKTPALTSVSFRTYRKEAIYVGIFANAVLFILIAQLLDEHLLLRYWKEITIVFLITTLLRFMLTGSLALICHYPFRWVNALTFAGMKGGLAIIMIHSLPDDLAHKEMLEAIVLGVVIASIFIYTAVLIGYLATHRNSFRNDILAEASIINEKEIIKELGEAVEFDPVTGIYHKVKFDSILNHEIIRAQRYNTPLSIVLIEFVNLSEIVSKLGEEKTNELLQQLRIILSSQVSTLDYIGRIAENRAAILTINRTPEEDLAVAETIQRHMQRFASKNNIHLKLCFAIANYIECDMPEMLYEKVEEALQRARQHDCSIIGIAM